MIVLAWLRGLLAHRRARLLVTASGVGVAVALLASIGIFLSATTHQMTGRAAARVSVDWQVEGRGDLTPIVRRQPGVVRALPVAYAPAKGFSAHGGGATQTTGPGRVLGLPDGYARAFPGEIRLLAGRGDGVLLAQQTAANLHAAPGSVITIGHAMRVRVGGIVDLPAADSLFQRVGLPQGVQPQAPPDNVVLLPRRLFDRVERGRAVQQQVHARVSRRLPGSPSAAYAQVSGRARNLETKLAGRGLVGDNLGTTLDQARSDALYAQLLFAFLGLPGAVLAGLITASLASAGRDRRRRDAALLRTRGATTGRLVRLALAEAGVAGAAGVAAGLVASALIGAAAFGTTRLAVPWAAGSAALGLVIAALAIVLPSWHDAQALTVRAQRLEIGRDRGSPWWARAGLDLLLLAGAGAVYWQVSRDAYQLVLAPEGVPQISVNWYALLAPALGWIGAGLLVHRVAALALARGQAPLARLLRPLAGPLASTVAAGMARQRRALATSLTLVALASAFAASTAVFNSTYRRQAEVDTRLTNGADVTVTAGADGAWRERARLSAIPGVTSIEPLQHRFAYVGADLQDLYGVRPRTIGAAGQLQDAWFQGGTASALMRTLERRPDAVLVSAETVQDFQLHRGDALRLRLQDARTGRYTTVPFHYAGVAKEFPTAPTDSFLVANAGYVAQRTGSASVGTVLVQTSTDPAAVAHRIRAQLGPAARVSDIVDQRRIVGSNLTAVELAGLTRVELAFALVLAVAASGLALGLGFHERRRTYAIARALGARGRRLGSLVWGESAYVTIGGVLLGSAAGAAISALLIKVLTGVFDPPPSAPAIPWPYLAALVALTFAAVAAAGTATLRALRAPSTEGLRDL